MTKQEKIDQIRAAKDPSYAMGIMANKMFGQMSLIKGEKGDKGDKPIKYVDYFTVDDINKIINYVQSKVKPGPAGRDSTVPGPRGLKGENGKDGLTPSISLIVSDVLSKIPKPKDGIAPGIEDIATLVINKLPKQSQELLTKTELINFLKRGGYRGGGLSTVSVDNVTITGNGTPQSPLVSVGGSGVSIETPSGSLYDQNTGTGGITFTVLHTPKWIVADGATFFAGFGYTIATLTITMTNPVTQFIRSFY